MNLQALRSLGVVASLSPSGKIQFTAGAGVMTGEVKSRITANRDLLIGELQIQDESVNMVNIKSPCGTEEEKKYTQPNDVHHAFNLIEEQGDAQGTSFQCPPDIGKQCSPSSPPLTQLDSNSSSEEIDTGFGTMDIQSLSELGITVSLSPIGKLRFKALQGVMTPEIRSRIAANSDMLIDELHRTSEPVNMVNLVNECGQRIRWCDVHDR